MTVLAVRQALIADAGVQALVGQKIGPLQEMQGLDFPYVILGLGKLDPFNTLNGSAGLSREVIELDAWAFKYGDAVQLADVCRTALNNAGFLCLGLTADKFEFQQDSGLYRHGYQFQAWST